jgi:hypothetical protein
MNNDRRAADAFYRMSFGAFAYAAYAELNPNAPLIPNWHIDCICHHLQEMGHLLERERSTEIDRQNIHPRNGYYGSLCTSDVGVLEMCR